jgi:hypothetical protein
MEIPYTQFIRPHGRQVKHTTELPDELADKWTQLCDRGCRLTMEVMLGGWINICVEDSEMDDDVTMLNVQNGPEVLTAVAELVRSFDPATHEEWRQTVCGEQEMPQDAADLAGPDD